MKRNYSVAEGKTITELHEELVEVYKNSEYSDRDVGIGFKEMVKLFAKDDFYNLHFVAKAFLPYLDISEKL